MHASGAPLIVSVPTAFGIAAVVNYLLCVTFLFHRNARWKNITEWSLYALVVIVIGTIDYELTRWLIGNQFAPLAAKSISTLLLPVLNFAGRRFLVFPSPRRGPWGPGQKLDSNGWNRHRVKHRLVVTAQGKSRLAVPCVPAYRHPLVQPNGTHPVP
jgi:putative flippase GtrA